MHSDVEGQYKGHPFGPLLDYMVVMVSCFHGKEKGREWQSETKRGEQERTVTIQ
jgi:hypothetical protein